MSLVVDSRLWALGLSVVDVNSGRFQWSFRPGQSHSLACFKRCPPFRGRGSSFQFVFDASIGPLLNSGRSTYSVALPVLHAKNTRIYTYIYIIYMCVCDGERERERERYILYTYSHIGMYLYIYLLYRLTHIIIQITLGC